MTDSEYKLFNLRNLKAEISKIFNILNNRAMQASGSERDILKAAVERLQLLSRTNDADAMEEALTNFHKLEERSASKPVVSEHAYNLQLQERLTKAHENR